MTFHSTSDQHAPDAAPHAASDPLGEAEAARDELRDALAGAGVTLPSLCVEAASYADEKPRPLLDLGRCNVLTARRIAAALRTGQDAPDLALHHPCGARALTPSRSSRVTPGWGHQIAVSRPHLGSLPYPIRPRLA